MERISSNNVESESARRGRVVQGRQSPGKEIASGIDSSPMMTAQRKKLDSLFGGAIQRVEEEEPLQGKFDAASIDAAKSNNTGPPPQYQNVTQPKVTAFRVSESDLIGLTGQTAAGSGIVQREKMQVMLGGNLPRVEMEVTFSESASKHVGSDEITLKRSTLQALGAEGISTEDQGGGVHRFKINNGIGYLVYRRDGNNVTVFHFHWNYKLDDPLVV